MFIAADLGSLAVDGDVPPVARGVSRRSRYTLAHVVVRCRCETGRRLTMTSWTAFDCERSRSRAG
jgi:hypothetical protein